MPELPKVRPSLALTLVALLGAGCGPGGFASEGSEFGDDGTSTINDEIGSSGSSDSTTGPDPQPETETETETGADDWTDPDFGPPDLPDPIDADCSRVWTHLDSEESHGHIGATPIGPRSAGGFLSVNPIVASIDGVNIDVRIRSWTADGELDWDRNISWDIQRDDALALLTDDLGDVFLGGRINANTFEDAMVAKLDGLTGEVLWTYLHGEPGGFPWIAHNGAALIAVGTIGEFNGQGLVVMAFEPDTGAVLWQSSSLNVGGGPNVGGVTIAEGFVDVLVRDQSQLKIFRYEPLATEPTMITPFLGDPSLDAHPLGFDHFGPEQLAILYYSNNVGSFVAIVDRLTGSLIETVALDDYDLAANVNAIKLVELKGSQGLAIAGTLWGDDVTDIETFVLRLDNELQMVCSGRLGKADLGTSQSPQLRGLAVDDDGTLTTGSFTGSNRRSAFARWK